MKLYVPIVFVVIHSSAGHAIADPANRSEALENITGKWMVEASGGPMTGDTGPETFEFDLEDGVLSGELVTGDGRRTMTGLTFRDGTLTWTFPAAWRTPSP